jgi:beta-phosphoglucomutase family hydrolase
MLARAGVLLRSGESVILDASWTDAAQRARVRDLAASAVAALDELQCIVPPEVAEARILQRLAEGVDASDATPEVARALAAVADPWPEAVPIECHPTPDAATNRSLRLLTARPTRAVLFDTDGVITDTAVLHEAAWRETFDALLAEHARSAGSEPFTHEDYLRHVDGRSRVDGVRTFLESRSVHLPLGSADDPPGSGTYHAVGRRKDERFREIVAAGGVEPLAGTVDLLHQLRQLGITTGAVSASRNCALVLERAGVAELFDVRVDGVDVAALGLPGKPDPALFLEAARRLEVLPADACVVEDAGVGIDAARRGGFGRVIGRAAADERDALLAAGADLVVARLDALDLRWLGVTTSFDAPDATPEAPVSSQ